MDPLFPHLKNGNKNSTDNTSKTYTLSQVFSRCFLPWILIGISELRECSSYSSKGAALTSRGPVLSIHTPLATTLILSVCPPPYAHLHSSPSSDLPDPTRIILNHIFLEILYDPEYLVKSLGSWMVFDSKQTNSGNKATNIRHAKNTFITFALSHKWCPTDTSKISKSINNK